MGARLERQPRSEVSNRASKVKQINFEGMVHSFPDDAGDDEVAAALGASTPAPVASQSDVRRVDNAIEEKAAYAKMVGGLPLKTLDKQAMMGVFLPAHEELQIERDDLTPTNFTALESEIKRAKDPKIKQVLTDEHHRMKASMANILGIK